MTVRISVIATVYNEADNIHILLDSLLAQTRKPDEVVIVDGGSSDGTPDHIRAYAGRMPLRVIVRPGCNISAGRNVAIAASTGDIIAATDAGVRLAPDWLAEITAPFFEESDAPPDFVSGIFLPDPQTTFEVALAATVLPTPEEFRRGRFLPSSRSVAFRREVWEAVGGYPEWMDYSEDVLFDLAVMRHGYRVVYAPRAVVHFRPRPGLLAYWRQYRNYAFGDGEGLLWPKRHLIRYATYLLAAPVLLRLALLRRTWVGWLGLAAGVAAYTSAPYRRLRPALPALPKVQRAYAILWVPLIRFWGDLAKMVGYPLGLPRGWKNRGRTRRYVDKS
ncbi:MAG: glycosyltransferase [Chloroflexi bacterium]|nr:glycosyltransferase [Chloroflexota bacterium]